MSAHAVAIRRHDTTLALLLRIVRSPSGIYVVFAAGQHREGHDPHSSWHRDGRVHHKSHGREFSREKRQALKSFTGVELCVITPIPGGDPMRLPDCDESTFGRVIEVPVQASTNNPSDTHIYVELLGARDAAPTALAFKNQLLDRSVLTDGSPAIAVSFYDVHIQWEPPSSPARGASIASR